MTTTSGDSVETQLVHVREKIATLTEKVSGADKALSVAMLAMDKRLDGMNELRDTMRDQQGTFLRTESYQTAHESLVREIAVLRNDFVEMRVKVEKGSSNLQGRYAIIAIVATVVLSSLGAIIVHIFSH